MHFYLIQIGKRCVLYTGAEQAPPEAKGSSQGGIDHVLEGLAERRVWWADRLCRLIKAVRNGYYQLENRLDPMEAVFKRMRHHKQLTFYVPSSLSQAESLAKLRSLLGSQRKRHAAWMIFDALLALGVLPFTPFLVPIPGPNIFFYYPALRAISHYLAFQGASSGLGQNDPKLVPLDEIASLETLIGQVGSRDKVDQIRQLSLDLKLEQLPEFIARYT